MKNHKNYIFKVREDEFDVVNDLHQQLADCKTELEVARARIQQLESRTEDNLTERLYLALMGLWGYTYDYTDALHPNGCKCIIHEAEMVLEAAESRGYDFFTLQSKTIANDASERENSDMPFSMVV